MEQNLETTNPQQDDKLKKTDYYHQQNSGKPGAPDNSPGHAKRGPNLFNIMAILFIITFLANLLTIKMGSSELTIEYSAFIDMVETDIVDTVELTTEKAYIRLKEDADMDAVEAILYPSGKDEQNDLNISVDTIFRTERVEDAQLTERLRAHDVNFFQQAITTNGPIMSFITTWVLPILLMYFLYSFLMRSMSKRMGGGMGGMFGVGKSKAKEYNVEKSTNVSFADVAGQDEAKESLMELADFLHDPSKYEAIGAKQPKGALLVGPPGTGKTLLARALAGETKVPFYSISGSEFIEMFVGVGASRVRDLFENAKKNAPCIIFIDEIDAIGKKRDNQIGGNDEREQTLNQLLAEMDGFDGTQGIVVLAATNRPEILDQALLRPGRFDRRVIVERPDLIGREAILKVHSAKVKCAADVNLREIALATSGATGADLANMVNEGALLAVREGRNEVRQQDLMEAVEVVIAGKEKKDRVMNKKERRLVAYHEIGHALVSALQKNSQPVQKITIVPRTMGSLGYTMNVPEEERYLLTKDELLAQITTLLGGRAAEIVKFGTVTTGASNDIERATSMARSMVTQYGMSEKFGPIGLESIENRYLDGSRVTQFSPETGTAIDEEVRQILATCQKDATALLQQHADKLERLSEFLLEKENITGQEFMSLLNNDTTTA